MRSRRRSGKGCATVVTTPRCITAPGRCLFYTCPLLHFSTPTLLHSYTPTLLHSYTPTLLSPVRPEVRTHAEIAITQQELGEVLRLQLERIPRHRAERVRLAGIDEVIE